MKSEKGDVKGEKGDVRGERGDVKGERGDVKGEGELLGVERFLLYLHVERVVSIELKVRLCAELLDI